MQHFLERGQCKRLGQIIIHACREAPLAVSFQCICGEGHDGRVPGLRGLRFLFTNQGGGGQAVHFRHVAIHQHQVEWPIRERLDRLPAVFNHGGGAPK